MIPKKIYQTAPSYNIEERQANLMGSIKSINSEYTYYFMDDDECLEFIEENFDSRFVNMYRALPLGIMKADVWRVAVIYINGGVYCDTDVQAILPLDTMLRGKDIAILKEKPSDHNVNSIANFFFAAKPKHPALKSVLDLMVKEYKKTFNLEEPLLVQNFGMALFEEGINNHNVNYSLIPFEESIKYIQHRYFNTWKKSEERYKVGSKNTEPFTMFTTFNKNGYELYGKTWIKTFKENVASQRNNIFAKIYAHGIPELKDTHPQIEILDYDKEIPEHKDWKKKFLEISNHSDYARDMAVRFSHKGFVIQHALDRIKNGHAAWVDGDVEFHKSDYTHFPSNILTPNTALACQVEDANHVESGIVLFNMNNSEVAEFIKCFKKNYSVEEMNNYGEPYDGHVIRRSLVHSKVNYLNLNEQYGIGGIQSDPNMTFLHPELKKRFTHNIGVTGKTQYSDWSRLKNKDKFFRLLDKMVVPMTPIQSKYNKLKAKRLKYRNR